MLTQETLNYIHDAYNEAVKSRHVHTILDIQEELLSILNGYTPPEEDYQQFDILLKNLELSISTRLKTFELTNLASDILFTISLIAVWANEKKDLDIDANISARRKSLESENVKYLDKATLEIHDLFGIRIIILNKDSEEKCVEILKSFFNFIVNILSGSKVNPDRKEFTKWLSTATAKRLAGPYIERISHVLSLPLRSWRFKNYIDDPKVNSYKSIHFILSVELTSEILPGAELEIQLRTYKMHINALHGEASQDDYKKRLELLQKVFTIDSPSNQDIIGFFGYNSPEDDLDGLHFGKNFISRRISRTLVPQKKK